MWKVLGAVTLAVMLAACTTPIDVAFQKEMDRQDAVCAAKGQPRIGMTYAQATATCWGNPEKVNKTVTGSRTNEQFVYGDGNYLYFADGVLTTIQKSGGGARNGAVQKSSAG